MSMTTGNMSLLTRAELWSQELKDTLKDELMGRKYVRMLTEFPDGTTFTIPSVGDARTDDVVEDTDIQMRALDTRTVFSVNSKVFSIVPEPSANVPSFWLAETKPST